MHLQNHTTRTVTKMDQMFTTQMQNLPVLLIRHLTPEMAQF
jgi:hypothetical protein